MRIAIFSEVYWPMVSGVALTLTRLADAMRARGHDVRVFTATYDLPEGEPDRPEVERFPSTPLFLYPDVQWAFPRQRSVRAALARFRPDVAHVATEFAVGRAGALAARALGVPIVASAHTDYEIYASRYGLAWLVPLGWHYLRWLYGQASVVLAPSTVYEAHLHRRGVLHTAIWSRGIDRRRFGPQHRSAAYRAALGVGDDELLVTYVGRLAREKNLHLLLEAWGAVRERHPRARLALVGRGPLEDELRERAIPGVHLVGLLTGDALAQAYASADVFAFPSVTETFGNVLLEAMASGVPAVAAAAGGVLDYAQHGENALLAAPDDRASLAGQLERLLGDAALRERLRAGGLATAAGRGWDAIYDGLEGEYERAIGAGAPVSVAA